MLWLTPPTHQATSGLGSAPARAFWETPLSHSLPVPWPHLTVFKRALSGLLDHSRETCPLTLAAPFLSGKSDRHVFAVCAHPASSGNEPLRLAGVICFLLPGQEAFTVKYTSRTCMYLAPGKSDEGMLLKSAKLQLEHESPLTPSNPSSPTGSQDTLRD